jgi:hypothetical protein
MVRIFSPKTLYRRWNDDKIKEVFQDTWFAAPALAKIKNPISYNIHLKLCS